MSWDRTDRTLVELRQRLADAETPEQCQAVGQLARDALISLAQAVFRADLHLEPGQPVPSPTDSKRRLQAYVAVAFAGGSREEVRSYAIAAVHLADAVTHKRTAVLKDAKLASLAVHSLVRVIALAEGHELADSDVDWQGVKVRNRYFAWDGPALHGLPDRTAIPAPQEAIDAIRKLGHKPLFGRHDKLPRLQTAGALQVFETDRVSWRRELVMDGQVLLVRPLAGR
jgi:hypothetical protein